MPNKNKNPSHRQLDSSKFIKTDDLFESMLKEAIDYCRLDRCEEAIEILDKAISLDNFGETPEIFKQSVYNAKGGAQLLLGYYNQALESFHYSLSINPVDLNSLSNLGVLFRYLGKIESSIKVFETAIAIDSSFAIAQTNIAYAYLSVGRIKDGLTAIEWRWENSNLENSYRDYPASPWNGSQDLSEKSFYFGQSKGPKM